jgi:enoyl-CoA hydratase/carnithine racemase
MFVFKAGVVGAGAMGGEIAHVIADAGIPVVLEDIDQRRVDQGLEKARSLWQARVDAGRLDADELERRRELIFGTTGYETFGDVDFVIEAVPERIEIKQTVFSELDEATPGHAILASNTSSVSVTEIALATSRPDRVVGFHLLHPVSVTRLIEVIEGDETSLETVQAAVNFAQALRRTAIRCSDAPGFVVNRILTSSTSGGPGGAGADAAVVAERSVLKALVESCLVLEEGVASMRDIDLGMMAGAGMTPPPFARADQTGLDEVLVRLERACEEWGEGFEPPTILRRLVAQGRLGVTAGQGFFPYPRPDADWEDSPVKLETRGAVAIAWLDRPPANSISSEVVRALRKLWDEIRATGTVRALVIASANPTLFCAGADIKAFTTMDAAAGTELLDGMHGLLREIETAPVVTIAAVNAMALGGGCELAMACDLRIAAESATFGQPEINLGIMPGFGGTQRLPRLVGEGRALELNLTGDPIPAEEAYAIGLANRVVADEQLFDTALGWARKLSEQAPLAVEQIKRVSAAADIDVGIEREKEAFVDVFSSEDAREGISAFVQRRKPRFSG